MSQPNEQHPRITNWLRRHRFRTIASTVALAAVALAAGSGFADCPQPTVPVAGMSVSAGPAIVSVGTGSACGGCRPGLVGVTSMLCGAQPQGLLSDIAVSVPAVSVSVGAPWSGCWSAAAPAPQVTVAAPPVAAPPAHVTVAAVAPAHHAHHRAHVSAHVYASPSGYACGCGYYPSFPSVGAYVSVGAFIPTVGVGVGVGW